MTTAGREDEDDDAEPGRDPRGDHDRSEVGDRAENEPERGLLVLERVAHRSGPLREAPAGSLTGPSAPAAQIR